MFVIEEELSRLPKCPGVYMHKDSLGEVIYVGKAINLRNRVRSYFRKTALEDPKVRAMVSNIAEFEYITCATEMEALVLECNLIKKYLPKYNILLKDGKSYPYIVVTVTEDYPRVFSTRNFRKDGNRYFGPYTDGAAVRDMIRMIDEMYPLKKCRQQEFRPGVRPCLNYFIGKCSGICIGETDRAEYMTMISEIIDILSGHDASVVASLTGKMEKASEKLEYEDAARYRDYIRSIEQLSKTQRASMVRDRDMDVLIPVITQKSCVVAQYKVRDGRLSGREITYIRSDFSGAADIPARDVLGSFIKQYYPLQTILPREILLPMHIEDEELLEEFLDTVNSANAEERSDTAHRTRILVPERGEKKALVRMASEDSVELSKSLDDRAQREQEKKDALRNELSAVIEYASEISGQAPVLIPEDDDREYRIEAYDISNFNGLDTVGAMVVYEGKKPVRSDYRKFKVRTAEGDDYGSLREVIYRRLKRAKNGDQGFSTYPDIMFIDGGLGQVHAVKSVVDAFRIAIPVVGLAKDDAHRTRAIVFEDGREIELRNNRLLFSYCGNIQEEVHRFAITYMSGVKGKKMIKSVLEDIPGIGPKRRAALLRTFGSIDAIRKATPEQLMEVDGMTAAAADSIIAFFRNSDKNPEHGLISDTLEN